MPRPRKSPTTLVVNFFMSAPVSEARQALEIAGAIVTARAASDGNGAAPRARRPRRTATQPPVAGTAASAPATPAAPRPRRSRRPSVGAAATASDTPIPATISSLPEQLAPGEE